VFSNVSRLRKIERMHRKVERDWMTCAMSLDAFAFVGSRRTVWDWVDLPPRWVEEAPPMIIVPQYKKDVPRTREDVVVE